MTQNFRKRTKRPTSNKSYGMGSYSQKTQDTRSVGMEAWPLKVTIDHRDMPGQHTRKKPPITHETLLVSAAVDYTTQSPDLSQNWNYCPLIDWLKAKQNMLLKTPLESLLDEVVGFIAGNTLKSRLKVQQIQVKIERPDLLKQWNENANVVLKRTISLQNINPKSRLKTLASLSLKS